MTTICIGCGECCKKHWLVRLMNRHEMELFKDHIVFGEFVWTDECPYQNNGKCLIQDEKPYKCKQYFCEKYLKE